MKVVVWTVFAVLAGLWTGAFALAAGVVTWVGRWLAKAADPNATVPTFTVDIPPWLEPWIDAGMIEQAQRMLERVIRSVQAAQPDVGSVVDVTVVVVWVACALGLALMLALAVAAHRWAGRSAPANGVAAS